MKFNLTLKNIAEVKTFIAICDALEVEFSPDTARGIIEFGCAVATLDAKPTERVQRFGEIVKKVRALINEVKAQYCEEGMDVAEWGVELCYDCEPSPKWEQLRRSNNVINGVVLYLDEEHSELYDWTK